MCLEEAPFYAAVSMPTVQNATPCRQRKRSRRLLTSLVCEEMRRKRNESTVLHAIRVAPWRRGAPKAQDGSPKRHERQWSGEGLVASDLGLRASPHIYCSEAATTILNPEPRNLFPFENDPRKSLLTQRRQTDTITHA